MKTACAALLVTGAALASPAHAQIMLQSYEPNTLGVTNDSDDVAFLDIKLSLRYPVMQKLFAENFSSSRMYFAASVRFAQYLGTRESSPVVGKRFNPKLIWRLLEPANTGLDYVDFAYAHESNGQSINSPEEFLAEVQQQTAEGGRPQFARDYISRGWDYLELAARYSSRRAQPDRLSVYPSFRLFLDQGLLQGPAEEYNSWENDPEGKPRKDVQGLAVLLRHDLRFEHPRLTGVKVALGLETGYARPLRYNTVRLELRADVYELPLMVFYQNGYNSDLALYYKRVSTVGLGLELATFQ